jgi:type IV secretion system protein VirB6
MPFTPFTSLSNAVDSATANYVTTFSQGIITTISPVATIAVTLYITLYGFAVMRGAVQSPLGELLMNMIKISVITAIALSVGTYQSTIVAPLQELQNVLPAAITGKQNIGAVIDNAAAEGFRLTADCIDAMPATSIGGAIAYALMALIVFLATSIIVSLSAGFIILAKVALVLLLGIGPLFLFLLLFKSTAKFFDAWLGQALNYVFLTLLVSAVTGFMTSIFQNFVSDFNVNSTADIWQAVGMTFILAIVDIIFMLQLPGIAAGLAGGSAISSMVSQVRGFAGNSGGKSSQKSGSSTGGGSIQGGQSKLSKASYAAGRATGTVAKAGAGAVGVAKGYFRRAVA